MVAGVCPKPNPVAAGAACGAGAPRPRLGAGAVAPKEKPLGAGAVVAAVGAAGVADVNPKEKPPVAWGATGVDVIPAPPKPKPVVGAEDGALQRNQGNYKTFKKIKVQN